ncbi:MAG: pyridoxamine 5'-phosphate oxidase family protein [Candidatus Omnitrophica bacterium]|nr:pyridoxamine 5'-phosphate oxidase family protein [Candidatus Omnitrophota bacterium]
MQRLSPQIINFFLDQGCVIVSTIDQHGFAHSACKGIVKIDPRGEVYLLDVYRAKTYQNLKRNLHITVTAIDEHKFSGYCLKGKARMRSRDNFDAELLQAWEDRITSRLTQRLLRNIRQEKGHPRHPEALLPKPEYLIVMKVEKIVDLTPRHLK